MPVFERRWDDLGVAETLRYRWMTGQQTLIAGISKLPHWHRVFFARSGEISIRKTAQRPNWPTKFPEVSFSAKLDETRGALSEVLGEVAQSFDKAAILFSGGVDSSLLAALTRLYWQRYPNRASNNASWLRPYLSAKAIPNSKSRSPSRRFCRSNTCWLN